MKTKLTTAALAAAVAGAFAISTVPANAAVKCYGISKKGENDCANKKAGHSCKGQNKVSFDGNDWKLVADAGACASAKGKTKPLDGINKMLKS